jgi:hypothetical protein
MRQPHGPEYEAVLERLRCAPHQITPKHKVKKFEFGLIVRIQHLLRVPGLLDRRSMLDCGEPQYQRACREERVRASGSAKPTTVGVLGKAHRIHAVVNNHQVEHQSTVLEMIGTVADQTLSI